MDGETSKRIPWNDRSPKEAIFFLIEDFKNKYARDYEKDSVRFQKYYFTSSILVIVFGVLISTLAVLQHQRLFEGFGEFISLLLVILPIISSGIVALSSQFGFREKFSLRETARIEASFYYNVARAKYYECKNDQEFIELFKWLTGMMKDIQDKQKGGYLTSSKDISVSK